MPSRYGANRPPVSTIDRQSPQARGLIRRFALGNSGVGDSVGGGEIGTATGGVAYRSRPGLGLCPVFDGTNDHIDYGDVSFLDGLTALTVSCWVVADSLAVSSRIVAKWGTSLRTDTDFILSLDDTNSDRLIFAVGRLGSVDVRNTSSAVIAVGVPTLIVLVWYATGNFALYVNGASVALGSVLNDGASDVGSSNAPLRIGAAGVTATPSNFFAGSITDVRFYNRALTPSEAWALYDPDTRWDLDVPFTRTAYKVPAAVAPATSTSDALIIFRAA